jgi:hypothetical protein
MEALSGDGQRRLMTISDVPTMASHPLRRGRQPRPSPDQFQKALVDSASLPAAVVAFGMLDAEEACVCGRF